MTTKFQNIVKTRRLRLEPLEERRLLSVTVEDFSQIRATYTDLNLGEYGDYNIIEVTDLTEQSLRDAITEAGTTEQNDLIVVRTTQDANTITLSGTALGINIDAEEFGSVTIVSLGETQLTINGGQKPYPSMSPYDFYHAFYIVDSDVMLVGLTIKEAADGGIYNGGTLTVTNCTISDNSRGIYNSSGGTLTVTNSTISGNSALDGSDGGGICNYGTMTPPATPLRILKINEYYQHRNAVATFCHQRTTRKRIARRGIDLRKIHQCKWT